MGRVKIQTLKINSAFFRALGNKIDFTKHGLPPAKPEYRFHKTRKWRFDYAWPDRLVALEIQGGIWTQGRHSRGSGLIKEYEKMNHAAAGGWAIFYCTPQTVTSPELIELLKRSLGLY